MPGLQGTSGALTFLFTDIEGSTRRWEADPVDMGAALARHDTILQAKIAEAGGTVFKHTGDGCLAVFPSAEQAIAASVAVQRTFATEPLVLRVAIHSGPAEQRDDDYFGPTLNRAARLLGAGHGGQVLVSDVTASLARGRIADDVTLVDLGEHRLRDISDPERVHQVVVADLGTEFPPLKAERHSLGTLPVPRTSLVGRGDAIDEVAALVRGHRLVTLTGVGGTGKTRLSIAVANQVKDGLRDGACFVDLAPVADAEAVPRAVAEAIGMPLVAGQAIDEDLGRFLHSVEAVLVLDNCEHILDEAADLVDLLLEHAPELRILVTSREALAVDGEHHWRVPSLATVSDATTGLPPAAALFLDRAAAAGGLLDPDADLGTVTAIATRLDGIPLAIELAAARTAHLAPSEILAMLDDRFTLLGGGRRRARQRQATLQAAVDWSHDLLGEQEQQLLRRLAVFAGSFTMDAVIAICGDGRVAVTSSLTSLVDKSLVVALPGPTGMRYRMLETIRLYAQEKLTAAGESIEYRDRHRDHFLAWSEATDTTSRPTAVQERAEPEAENLRAAIDWSLERDRPDLVARQVVAVAWCWFQGLRSDEAEAWLAATAERSDATLDLESRIGWRAARVLFAMEPSDQDALRHWVTEVTTLGDGTDSPWAGVVAGLRSLFMTYVQPDAVDENLRFVIEARNHPGNVRNPASSSALAYSEAHALLAGGRYDEAIAAARAGCDDPEADPYWATTCRGLLVVARHLTTEPRAATVDAEALLDALVDLGTNPGRYADLMIPMAASVAFAGAGDNDRARSLLRAQLDTLARRYAHLPNALGIPLVNTAVLLALGGDAARATRILGGIGRRGMQTRGESAFALFRAYSARLHAALGDDAFLACLTESETLTLDDLLAVAHEVASG